MTVSHLHALVTALDESRPMTAPPALVRIRGPVACPERIDDLALDQIMGFTAPASCSALGVVATGWAFAYCDAAVATGQGGNGTTPGPVGPGAGVTNGSTPGPVGPGEASTNGSNRKHRERVRSTVVVSRDGAVAGRIRWLSGRVVDEAPDSGRIFDCLHRGLGLATRPPAVGTDVLFASMWLAALQEVSEAGRGRDLAWFDAVALHPVAQVMGRDLPGCDDGLVDTARALAVACPWREIRRMISDCDWEEAGIPAGIAAWMDDGMLSRWLLDGRMTLAEQLRRLDRQLAPDLARRVRRVLRQLGLPGAPVSTRRNCG